MPNPKLYSLTEPLDMDDAREATKALGRQRHDAREHFERAIEESADAERDYRKTLAICFVKAEGDTAAQREANARAAAADASYRRARPSGHACRSSGSTRSGDPIWLGLKVPSEEPWRPFADRKAVEKAAKRARRTRVF